MKRLSVLFFVLFLGLSTEAKRLGKKPVDVAPQSSVSQKFTGLAHDQDLIRAVNDRRDVRFVEAGQLTVTQVLPDDREGRPHQRWYVRLSNGQKVLVVYNLGMGQRVPLQEGTVMGLGGEFKWTRRGPLMHWLHYDPREERPHGYVEVDGVRYGLH